MRTSLARRRQKALLAVCALGLVVTATACRPPMICGNVPGDPVVPAGQGK